jgi:hypothetical protein
MLQLSADGFSGISVEAADNLSDSLIESTAFFKKSYLRTFTKNRAALRRARLFERAGDSRDSNESCNPKVQLFRFMYQRSNVPPRGGSLPDLHRVLQRPVCFEQGGL